MTNNRLVFISYGKHVISVLILMINNYWERLIFRDLQVRLLDIHSPLSYFYFVQNNWIMDNNSALHQETFTGDNFYEPVMRTRNSSAGNRKEVNPLLEAMVSEGSEYFFNYIDKMGFSHEPDLLILSSRHHYYYDNDDLRGVRILISLKKLNFIKHLDSFLHVLFRMLPPRARFVGCFTNSQSDGNKGFNFNHNNGFFSRFLNFLDARTDRQLSKEEVTRMLESHGFKVLDMTEINGEVYFSTQNKKMSVA